MRALILRTIPMVLLAVVVTLMGCVSQRELLSDPVRNDELLDRLAQQSFRGRWWNLYEQAFIYQEFELWALAEEDIRAALNVRNVDQRWARTYGLHFIPEYFPNRELGIVLFHQHRYDEAIDYLEKSIDHQYTARAAYYLNDARAQRVTLAQLDNAPPTIELLSPVQGGLVGTTQVDVRAIARDETYVAKVVINGERVPLRVTAQEVLIERTVTLVPGTNSFNIEVTDIFGNSTVEQVSLRLDTDGPAISFNTPIVLPGTIRGVAFDPSGIEAMYIGDSKAILGLGAGGETTFEFFVEEISDRFVPQFRCVDALGNSTEGLLPLDGILTEALRRDVVFASSTSVVPLNDEIAAVYVGGELLAVIRSARSDRLPGAPRIEFTNLLDGQRYLKDEIVVSLDIQSTKAIQSIELNGQPIETIVPGRGSQRISRRIRIEDEGEHRIIATVVDVSGALGTVEVVIERRLPQVEEVSARLSVALLGDLSRSDDASLHEQAEYLRSELPFALDERGRFNVIDRESIETVIEEQQLIAALGSVKERQRLGQLEMADFLLIADLRKYGENLEILVHAIDSITSREVIVDVYGPANELKELRELVHNLALRLEQEFPRVQGSLLRVASNGERVFSDLSKDDRIWKSMYCVIYRPQEVVDPETQVSLGIDLVLIAQGTLRDIRKQGSSIQLLLNSSENAGSAPQLSDLVITK